MRVALLASTIAFLLASPAAAQCVYVACAGAQPNAPVYQAPLAQPVVQSRTFEEGYAAGLAARTDSRRTTHRHTTARPKARTTTRAVTRTTTPPRRHHVTSTRSATSRAVAGRASHRVSAARVTPSKPRAHAHVTTTRTYTSHFQDPIKDRASTYRAQAVGSTTVLASHMSRSSSFSTSSSSTSWIGPAQVTSQGGQICGWGTRIETNQQGFAQRHAAWLCQCAQGWRPPGY